MVNYTYFFTDRVCEAIKEMDPQLPVSYEDDPSFAVNEPLLFLTDLGRVISQFHPISGYSYFTSPPLLPCDHPVNGLRLETRIYQT